MNDSYSAQGGVQQYILSVSRLLASYGHENVVVYTRNEAHTIRDGLWPSYFIPAEAEGLKEQLQDVIDAERPDIAYIHHVSSSSLIDMLSHLIPAVAYVHGFSSVCPGLGKYFRRGDVVCERASGWGCIPMHYLRRCSDARDPRSVYRVVQSAATLRHTLLRLPRLLVGSDYMRSLLMQNAFPSEQVVILPPHFLSDEEILDCDPPEELGIVLFAGRLEIEKGFPYLLHAMTELPSGVQLMVAGDGTQRARYEVLAGNLGVERRVKFLGWLDPDAMSRAYRDCSVLAIPSICPETFGRIGIEALANCRPVVAFDVGGISDWLHNDVNGFLVKPRDSAGLARGIHALLRDDALRIRFGNNGRDMVSLNYTAERHLSILIPTFESAINSSD